eukprot:scaffold318039_cov36-Tisochrysis_lutea.AAC.1
MSSLEGVSGFVSPYYVTSIRPSQRRPRVDVRIFFSSHHCALRPSALAATGTAVRSLGHFAPPVGEVRRSGRRLWSHGPRVAETWGSGAYLGG